MRTFRSSRGIAVYCEGERQARNELTQSEAAAKLQICARTLNRLIQCGVIPARQACRDAPWVISAYALELPKVKLALEDKNFPSAQKTDQQAFEFQ